MIVLIPVESRVGDHQRAVALVPVVHVIGEVYARNRAWRVDGIDRSGDAHRFLYAPHRPPLIQLPDDGDKIPLSGENNFTAAQVFVCVDGGTARAMRECDPLTGFAHDHADIAVALQMRRRHLAHIGLLAAVANRFPQVVLG